MLIIRQATENIEKEVELFEETYGIIIPEQYKQFLLKYNGGETPETTFRIEKTSSNLTAFFGLGDVEDNFKCIVDLESFLKRNFLPIAYDLFGNYIVIDLDENKNGEINFCDHEKEFKAVFLAKDLKTFVKSVKSKKMDEYYTMSIEEREKRMIANGNADKITDKLRENWKKTVDRYSNAKQERVIIN